jgi:hypothetical protein
MALGGGTFTAMTKVLPGAYINFVSAAQAQADSTRGTVAMPLLLDWGVSAAVFEVTQDDFLDNDKCKAIFGYANTSDELKNVREMFIKATKAYCYRLNGGGVAASNTFATANYAGTRGNDFSIVIAANVDTPTDFDVSLLIDGVVYETQTVTTAAGLIDNDFVTYDKAATLAATAGTALAGGTNVTSITGEIFQDFLDAMEQYQFNILGCPSVDTTIHALFDNYTKRMRDELGIKFQLVRPKSTTVVDYEGVIQVQNTVSDAGATGYELVFFTAGDQAACAINSSTMVNVYTGEYTVNVNYTQTQLENFIKAGIYAYHRNGTDVCVLSDINSLVTFTDDKGKGFSKNQAIRVIDDIAINVGSKIFNANYLGKINNDADGRISLWNDITKYHQDLVTNGAIVDYKTDDTVVASGGDGKVVISDVITVNKVMEQLYMTVSVA